MDPSERSVMEINFRRENVETIGGRTGEAGYKQRVRDAQCQDGVRGTCGVEILRDKFKQGKLPLVM